MPSENISQIQLIGKGKNVGCCEWKKYEFNLIHEKYTNQINYLIYLIVCYVVKFVYREEENTFCQ